ncbi:methionine ABC transporter ATP-binding protein [Aquisphaera insulae]|uniref:methionine ABC transporter ATP-binding protein n=1 Tax=Aquisphaera insulae TaxID=2712864 RepID=UPI0013EC19CE|nr:ATP-binding cassette domain-containing protein [Aquisphaera insulae]
MIRVESISKRYHTPHGTIAALRDVSFQVSEGEVHGLIGLSGAGKSTALRAINLLERPDDGRVLIDGEDLLAKRPHELRQTRQRIGMIFQHFNLLANRTVAGNVAFPLEVAGWRPPDIRPRVAEMLELMQIAEKANAYPANLSGGQKQRVAIARSIANHPRVLLADEPTSALDPLIKNDILACLSDLNRRLGLTIIIAAHEMRVIRRLCHRVSLFKAGEVVEELEVEDGTIRPRSEFGRQFVEED